MTLKTNIEYTWRLRNGKRASKFAHVYYFSDAFRPWTAQKKNCFARTFKTEREAGEFVARQLGATLLAVMVPGWDESMRNIPKVEPLNEKPKPKLCKMVCRPRRLVVRIVERPDIGELVHSGRDLVSGVSEQSADGYEEMQNRGAI